MNRTIVARGIVAIAILSGIPKWVPSDDPFLTYGVGAALRSLADDGACRNATGDEDARVHLLSFDLIENEEYWTKVFAAARGIAEQAGPGDLVQAKGLPRNTLWILRYLLYPLRVAGFSRETGSTRRDARVEEATFVVFVGEGGKVGWHRIEP